jgi:hypothetical protein
MNHKDEKRRKISYWKKIVYVISTCVSEEIAEEYAKGGGGEGLFNLFTAYWKKSCQIPSFLDGFQTRFGPPSTPFDSKLRCLPCLSEGDLALIKATDSSEQPKEH